MNFIPFLITLHNSEFNFINLKLFNFVHSIIISLILIVALFINNFQFNHLNFSFLIIVPQIKKFAKSIILSFNQFVIIILIFSIHSNAFINLVIFLSL